VPIAILPHPELKDYGRVRELAQALDPGCIVESSGGMYVNDGILCVEATRAGVPCLTFEIGEGGRLEPDVVRTGAACIRNVMSWLNMSDDAHTAPKHRYVMRSFVGLRAKHGGLLYNEVALGAEVRRGDLLCRIVNIYGDDVQHVVAPDDGVFVRATTLSTVSTGERVATLGIV
jgi:predicted deacylase